MLEENHNQVWVPLSIKLLLGRSDFQVSNHIIAIVHHIMMMTIFLIDHIILAIVLHIMMTIIAMVYHIMMFILILLRLLTHFLPL